MNWLSPSSTSAVTAIVAFSCVAAGEPAACRYDEVASRSTLEGLASPASTAGFPVLGESWDDALASESVAIRTQALALKELQRGWNGDDAEPPSRACVQRVLVAALQSHEILPERPIRLVADADGGATAYIYSRDTNRVVSVSFSNDNTASILFFNHEGDESREVAFSGDVVPEGLLRSMLVRIA